MKALLIVPVGSCGNHVADGSQRHEEEVHSKTRPYQQTSLLIPPHLAHTVVDDVAYGENDETSGKRNRTYCNLLCFKHVCQDEANGEEYAEKHEQHTHLSFSFLHFSCFLRGLPSTRVHKYKGGTTHPLQNRLQNYNYYLKLPNFEIVICCFSLSKYKY